MNTKGHGVSRALFICALYESLRNVRVGLVPTIHAWLPGTKNVDARDRPGHDGLSC